MANKKKTFSIDNDVANKFEDTCFQNAYNQSQLVGMLLEAFNLKGTELFSGIVWYPDKPAKLLDENNK